MLKYHILFLGVILFGVTATAQPLREPTYEMNLLKAEELQADGDNYNALDMFQECYNESKDYYLVSSIAKLNYLLRDYKRAEKWYQRMVEQPEKYYTKQLDTLHYARILKINRNYPTAFDYYRQYVAHGLSDSLVDMAENEIIGMDLAANMKEAKDIFVEPLPTDINTSLTEASPEMSKDGEIFYSTFKKKSKIVINSDSDDYHFKIYSSKKDDKGKWSKPKKLTKKINREDYHTGNVTFSKDGTTMFFTRSRINGDSLLSSKIYYSTYDGSKWEGARELVGVNGDWLATHPAAGDLFGNEVLYFTSDLPGGYGGYDIYYCTKKGGDEYSTPINLGKDINTKGDDVTPFYVDGTLYFSSDGKPGLGSLDIFSSTWDGVNWSSPRNMGLPHNSTYDDFYFSWNADEKKGYLVSNRPYAKKRSSKSETCCDDIFEVAEQDIEINTLVTVFDKEKNPLPGTKIILKEFNRGSLEIVDTKKSNKGNTFNLPLKIDKQYRVVIQHDNFNSDSFDINTVGLLDPKTFKKAFYLDPKERREEIKVYTINEPIRLNNIYYDFADDKILPDAEPDLYTLKGLMDQYKTMVIELSSHTDSRGNDQYNAGLSQRRAESARRWLISKGIHPARIQAVGYGENQILNECANGVSCDDESHRFNRRTEFKIIAGPTSIEVKKEVIGKPKGTGSLDNQNIDFGKGMASINHSPAAPMRNQISLLEEKNSASISEDSIDKKAKLSLKTKFKDFGIIQAGAQFSHILHFENIGTAALLIERVTGKKCLEITWPDYPILPGQKGEVELVYNSSDRKGEDELTVTIITNDEVHVHTSRVRAFVQE